MVFHQTLTPAKLPLPASDTAHGTRHTAHGYSFCFRTFKRAAVYLNKNRLIWKYGMIYVQI